MSVRFVCIDIRLSVAVWDVLRRRWTRVLLLQQLLVEVFDLLDPDL